MSIDSLTYRKCWVPYELPLFTLGGVHFPLCSSEVSSSSESEDEDKRYTTSGVSDTDRHLSEATGIDYGQASSDYQSARDDRSDGASSRLVKPPIHMVEIYQILFDI